MKRCMECGKNIPEGPQYLCEYCYNLRNYGDDEDPPSAPFPTVEIDYDDLPF